MNSSALTAALQDALEKGDIVELEQAITAAEDAIHVSANARKTPSSSLRSLIARAKNMYLAHMDACKAFVRPLRKACKELNERSIFEALVRARKAPDEVQLCMYTDLCNAESLRRDIMEAQRLGTQMQRSRSAREVDEFLTECSPLLDDRTILSLVKKREDLLREEQQRSVRGAAATPLRAGMSEFMKNSAQREPHSRFELEKERISPLIEDPPPSNYRNSRNEADNRIPYPCSRVVEGEFSNKATHSSNSAPTVYSEVCRSVQGIKDSDLQRIVTEGASPWMQAMRTLHQRTYEEVAQAEYTMRQQIEGAEEDTRVGAYREEILHRVQHWGGSSSVLPPSNEAAKAPGMSDEVGSTQRRSPLVDEEVGAAPASGGLLSSSTHQASTSTESKINAVEEPMMRVYATQSLAAYACRTRFPQLTPARVSRDDTAATVEGAILGSHVRQRIAEESNTPRLLRETPNISPIKEVSTVSGVASFSDQDHVHHRSNGNFSWGDEPDRGAPFERVLAGGSSTVTDTPAESSVTPSLSMSLELRRVQARFRALQQEESIHRHDIEGTEDFDRSVFLFPVSARIALLQRTVASQKRFY